MQYTIESLNCVVQQKKKKKSQLSIKLTQSFVAIELLTFCKNTKKYIAQESTWYSVRKQDCLF